MPTRSRRGLAVTCLVLALASLAACGRKGDVTDLRPPPAPEAQPAPAAPPAEGTGG